MREEMPEEVQAMVSMGFYPREYLRFDELTPEEKAEADDLVLEGDEDFRTFHDWVMSVHKDDRLSDAAKDDLIGRVTRNIVSGSALGAWVTLKVDV